MNITIVVQTTESTQEHENCRLTFDNCDKSLRIEDKHGEFVAHYDDWITVIQVVAR